MTIEEIKKTYGNEHGYVNCDNCPLDIPDGECKHVYDCSGYVDTYIRIQNHLNEQNNQNNQNLTEQNDVIKHPNHYCRENAMECIDEMIMVFGKEVVKNFCLCNIWKYRYRSADKNGKEDIEKSDQYIRIYKRLCSNE